MLSRFLLFFAFLLLPVSAHAKLPKKCVEAYNLSKKEQFTKALDLIPSKQCPLLTKYIKWKELRYADNNASFKEHYDFMKKNPSWPFLHQIRKNMERREPKGISDAKLKQWFMKEAPSTWQGVTLYAKLLQKYGVNSKANKIVRRHWHHHLRDKEKADKFFKLHQKILRPEDHLKRVQELLWDGKAEPAKPLLKYLKKPHREIAEARIALLENDEAKIKKALRKVPLKYRNDEGILYDRTKWHRRFDEDKALDFYQQVRPQIDTHVGKWVKEKHIVIRDGMRAGQYKKAYKLAASHSFKSGSNFAEAEWLAGFIAHRFLKDDKLAVKHFETLLKGLKKPPSITQAAYWGAKAQKRLGNEKRRVAWLKRAADYPLNYYGQLACEELGVTDYLKLQKSSGISQAQINKHKSHRFMPVLKMLQELDASHMSLPFLYLMYKHAKGWKDKLAVIELARTYSPENVVELLEIMEKSRNVKLKWAYPSLTDIKWRKGINKSLVHAIIRKESKFNPKVISWAGAIGVMQLMPKTGEYIAKELKVKNFKPSQLYDRSLNLRFGQFYVEESLERFEGHLPLMLAAYNAGHGNVNNKWVPKFGDPRTDKIDDETWIEMIPFMETRFYVMKVTAYYKIYKALLRK